MIVFFWSLPRNFAFFKTSIKYNYVSYSRIIFDTNISTHFKAFCKMNFVSPFNSWKVEKAHSFISNQLIRLENIKVTKLCKYTAITLAIWENVWFSFIPLSIIEPALNLRLFQQFVDYRTFGSKSFYQYISEVRCCFITTSASLLFVYAPYSALNHLTFVLLNSNLSSQFSSWNIKIKALWSGLQPAGTVLLLSLPNLFLIKHNGFCFHDWYM